MGNVYISAFLLSFYGLCHDFGILEIQTGTKVADMTSTNNTKHLLNLLKLSRKSTIICLWNPETEMEIGGLLSEWTETHGLYMMSYHLSSAERHLGPLIRDTLLGNRIVLYWKLFNFIVFCDNGCLTDVTKMISRLDKDYGRKAALRHFSKWLFVINRFERSPLPDIDIVIDNMAVAVQGTCQDKVAFPRTVSVMTLLWKEKNRKWSSVEELQDRPSRNQSVLFPNAGFGLNGRTLKIGTMEWGSFCKKSTLQGGSVAFIYLCRDLFDHLERVLNFSYEFVEPPDRSWGELSNGSWTGILGMVVRDEIDLAGIPYGVTKDRIGNVTFTYMQMFSSYQVCYTQADDGSNAWLSLVSCFKWEVYACGFFALLWSVGLFTVMEHIRTEHVNAEKRKEKDKLCSSFSTESIVTALRVPLNQGSLLQPRNASSRLLYVCWWIFCILITAVYTGNLIAFLTSDKEKMLFHDLEGLAADRDFHLIMPKASLIEAVLKESNDSTLKALWKKIQESKVEDFNSSLMELAQHKRLLETGRYAYIDWSNTIDELELTIHRLKRIKDNIVFFPVFLPFPKNSPLAELFSEKLLLLYDTGMMDFWTQNWRPKSGEKDDKTQPVRLKISHLQSALTTCGVGVVLAVIILVTENLRKLTTRVHRQAINVECEL